MTSQSATDPPRRPATGARTGTAGRVDTTERAGDGTAPRAPLATGPRPVERGALTRRSLVAAAAGAASLAALPTAVAAAALTDDLPVVVGPALEPELITVTDTSCAAWWRTLQPSDTTVVLRTLDGPAAGTVREHRLEEGRTVHAARIDGLLPGTRYAYELRSGGVRVSVGANPEADPGTFRTLVRPPGALLARIAVLNDLHVGETISGQIAGTPVGPIPPSYTGDDYAFRMLSAAIDELGGRPLDLVVANGDLSDAGGATDLGRALAQLRRLPVPLLVTRGNHDRRGQPAACGAPDRDCIRAAAFPGQAPGSPTLRSVARVGGAVAVVGLDSADPDTGKGRLDLGGQAAWLEARLRELRAEGRIVVVAFHHPVRPANATRPPSFSDHVGAGGPEVLAVLARHDHVRLVVHGHTHRNNLGFDPTIGERLAFLENGAIKEYPAGFCLLDVHEGGIMRTFHRPVDDFTREWVAKSAMELEGFQPAVTRGALDSRAFTIRFGRSFAGAGTAPVPAALRVRARRRHSVQQAVRRGVPIALEGTTGGRAVHVQIIARVGAADRSRPVVLASTRSQGRERLRVRLSRSGARVLRARGRSTRAVLRVEVDGRTTTRDLLFLG